jgi:signal peptidase II
MPDGGAPRRIRVLLAVAAAVLAADVISKVIVVSTLSGHPPIRLLGGVLTVLVLRNSGAAFSIGTSMTVVFTLIAVGVIVFILRTARMLRSLPWAATLGLLLGGATGNLVDRLARSPGPLRGDVVDWIQLPHWPVFNLADSAIVCGGALAILLSVRGTRIDGTREVTGGQPPGDAAEALDKVSSAALRAGGSTAGSPGDRGAELRPSRTALGDAEEPVAGQAGTGREAESAAPGVQGSAHEPVRAPESGVGDSGARQP